MRRPGRLTGRGRGAAGAPGAGLAGASVLSRAPGGGSAGASLAWGRRRQTDGAQPNGLRPASGLRAPTRPRARDPAPAPPGVRSCAGPALGGRTSGFRVVEPSPLLDVPIAAPPPCFIGGAAAKTLGTRETGAPRSGPPAWGTECSDLGGPAALRGRGGAAGGHLAQGPAPRAPPPGTPCHAVGYGPETGLVPDLPCGVVNRTVA